MKIDSKKKIQNAHKDLHSRVKQTNDGSHTLYSPTAGQTYHSTHGAVQESMRVFIELGLKRVLEIFDKAEPIRILEMGMGTGLNVLLTYLHNINPRVSRFIEYTAYEAYPISSLEALYLNYPQRLNTNDNSNIADVFRKIHSPIESQDQTSLSDRMTLTRSQDDFTSFAISPSTYHLVYYDAFSPNAQPELWTTELFARVRQSVMQGGVLTTYCSKSSVQRALRESGWSVEKHPGPPGKREVLRAIHL